MKSLGLSLAGLLVILGAAAPAEAKGGYQVVWDDFRTNFSANSSNARWFNFSMGPFVADDGLVSITKNGLSVVASGQNPITHLPAFVRTMGQDTGPLSAFDHVKWLVIMNHTSSKGLVGFDAEAGQELACEARISGQVFGTHGHPFGSAVAFADVDPRLGAVATSAFDPETFMIFNFLITNNLIYAFYEHPPFVRDLYGDYAAFTYAVPVAYRFPYQQHDLKIAYDKARGRVRWLIDGDEVFRVDAIGARIDRRWMLLDRGGEDMIFSPDQLDCGMGTFTFLDGFGPTQRALVQIDADEDTYFNPRWGEPFGVSFLDPTSAVKKRLFGQGAAMQVRRYVVSSRPASDQCD